MAKAKAEERLPVVTPADVAALLGLDPETRWRDIHIELDWGAPASKATEEAPARPGRPWRVRVIADVQDDFGAVHQGKIWAEEISDEQGT